MTDGNISVVRIPTELDMRTVGDLVSVNIVAGLYTGAGFDQMDISILDVTGNSGTVKFVLIVSGRAIS